MSAGGEVPSGRHWPALVMHVEGPEQESAVPPGEAIARDVPALSDAGCLLSLK